MNAVLAAEGGYQVFELTGAERAWLWFSVATALLAIGVGFILMRGVLAADQGTPKMQEIAAAIQQGAMAYLRRQFKTIVVILIPLLAVVFLTSTAVLRPDGSEACRSRSRVCGAPWRSSLAASCPASPALSVWAWRSAATSARQPRLAAARSPTR